MLNHLLALVSCIPRRVALCLFLLAIASSAQQLPGSLRGTVADTSGAGVPDAAVEVLQAQEVVRRSQTDELGNFSAVQLPAGEYSVRVVASGFQEFTSTVQKVTPGAVVQVAVTLSILTRLEQVTVTSDVGSSVSIESTENAGVVVLRGVDLDALPDDPDELLADLQALAGPPLGSSSTQVYLDGFSSSTLPPKNTIREVRINQDPFSAQYDHVGFGRVEVVTKPGTQQIHGTAQFKASDAVFNSRNPYSSIRPPYQSKQFAGELGGPMSKRASFFLNFEGRWATDNEVVNATILDASFHITPLAQTILTPVSGLSSAGRIDYKLSEKHTLTVRYEWDQSGQGSAGVGGFTLPSRAYAVSFNANTLQLTEETVLSNSTFNQTRVQFVRSNLGQKAVSFSPTIQVMDSFISGGAQVGNSRHYEDVLELQNITTRIRGAHTLTFGGRLHRDTIYDRSPANFGGTFVFSGGLAPELNASNQVVLDAQGNPVMVSLSSIQRYQRTLLLLQAGFSQPNVAAMGGGASQFSIATGQPVSTLTQSDMGFFVQDSWHLTPTLSLDAGLRWEWQNDIHDWKNFAPRMGLAWMPGGNSSKTVIRMGAGIFYDRFPAAQVLQTMRFNGRTQQQFVLKNPIFYPQVPSTALLEAFGLPQTVRTLAPNLQAPYLIQASLGIERELPLRMVASLNYIGTWGRRQLVSENITAPVNGGAAARGVAGGPAAEDNNYQFASVGTLNQNQFIASVRRSFRGGFTAFGEYDYKRAFANTDGVSTFPANQYNLQGDYGRAATDIRHTLVLGGALGGPFGTNLNPFLVVRSGAPFNITSGHDYNGDTLFTDRPAFATSPNQPGAVITRFGIFDPNPANGAAIIPHNYGQGPGFTTLNLRVSRTFGLGRSRNGGAARGAVPAGAVSPIFASASSDHPYNLTVAVIVRNLLNTSNPGTPVGNLSSPYFGCSNWLASAAGPADAVYGNNRRIQLQLRFDF